MILNPRKPTLKRWRKLSNIEYSILRALEYERIDGLELKGLILDVGGGKHNSYYHLLNNNGEIHSININPNIKPTICCDFNTTLPIASEQYDTVLSLNTFEHIVNDNLLAHEISRVLKPGGEAHLIVPFLYQIHGSPNDYHRHTADAWIAILTQAGFAQDSIVVEPLTFGGALTASFSLLEFLLRRPLRRIIRKVVLLLAVIETKPQSGKNTPLGYYIYATKSETTKEINK